MANERRDDDSDDEAEGCGERGENEALYQELADEAETRGPECSAQRRFVAAGDGAGELEVGDVSAGNEEHGGDAGEQDEERLAAVSADVALQRLDDDLDGFVVGDDLRDGGVQARLIEGLAALPAPAAC